MRCWVSLLRFPLTPVVEGLAYGCACANLRNYGADAGTFYSSCRTFGVFPSLGSVRCFDPCVTLGSFIRLGYCGAFGYFATLGSCRDFGSGTLNKPLEAWDSRL